MSGSYDLYKKVSERVKKEMEQKLSGTTPEFQCLVKNVTAPHSVTKTGVEKPYNALLL